MNRTLMKNNSYVILKYVLLFILMAFTLFPFLWLLSSSFKPSQELFSGTPRWLSSNFSIQGYDWIMRKGGGNLLPYYMNSLIVAIFTLIMGTFFAVTGGYAIARYKFPGLSAFLILLFLCQMFQGPLIMIPWYKTASMLHITNTKLCLVLVHGTITIPIIVFMMSGFFKTVPIEIEESAYIDGCTKLRTLISIDLPMVLPGFVSIAIISFIFSWNDYQYAFILTSTANAKTVQIAINEMVVAIGNINWPGLLAGGVLTTLPVMIFFAAVQKYLIQGLTAGAVKG